MELRLDQTLIEDLRTVLSQYCAISDLDDAVQEALIRAWQLLSGSDQYSRQKLIYKATDRGRSVASKNGGSVPFGKTARERTGQRHQAGNISREKIAQFQQEYKAIHGTLPTPTQISRGTGISTSNVREHLQRMKTDRKSLNVDERGRIKEHLQLSTIEIDPDYMGSTVEFEETLLSYLSFFEIVAPLSVFQRELMYMCHVQGMKTAEVAKCLGMADSTVRDRINRAHHTLRNHILTAQLL